MGGALAAFRDTRYKYDLVGVTGLALASALGGGVIGLTGFGLRILSLRYNWQTRSVRHDA